MAPDDDDLLPISALQHLLFCPRQCALIHLERLWIDNVLTIKGQLLHRRADRPAARRRLQRAVDAAGGSPTPTPTDLPTALNRRPLAGTVARAVPLRSLALGLSGVADVVEFLQPVLAGKPFTPFPVEYKRGKPKSNRCDEVQLCAQAMCLEEMLDMPVPAGAIFYGRTRRRIDISFTPALRELTRRTAADLQTLFSSHHTPAPVYEHRKCDRCSLKPLCLPEKLNSQTPPSAYFQSTLASMTGSQSPPEDPVSLPSSPPSAPPRKRKRPPPQ